MRHIVLLAAICVVVAAGGCGSGAARQSTEDKTPAQILVAALAAARKAGSAHYVLSSLGPAKGQKQMVTGNAGIKDGSQVIVGAGARWEALAVDDKVFITGDVKGLENEGFPSSVAVACANSWISVAPTDSPYETIIAELALYPALEELAPTGKLTMTAPTTWDGRQVVGISGSARTSTGSQANGTAVLYVTTATPFLPIGYSAEAANNGQTATETGTFSDWGKPVNLSAPTHSIAFSSLSANR
ncbi:MAG: hypothetical protein ACLP6E_11145 [Acidimicrobiales bacterium]